jgi:phosphate transport system permease protein
MRAWFKSGQPWVWMSSGAVSISLIMVVGLLILIAVRGLSHFWPADVKSISYVEPGQQAEIIVGEKVDHEIVTAARLKSAGVELPEGQETAGRTLLKTGNRDIYGIDFRWVNDFWIKEVSYPEDMVVIERREWGNFYGYLVNVKEKGEIVAEGDAAWDVFQERLERSNNLTYEIKSIEQFEVGKINHGLEELRLQERRLELKNIRPGTFEGKAAFAEIEEGRKQFDLQYAELRKELDELYIELARDSITVEVAGGRQVEIAMSKIVQAIKPNSLNTLEKVGQYFHEVWKFVSGEPREANTEGGIFPAIFGTVIMVLIMSILVTPFGVVAAVYLREYATQGPMIR